MNTIGNDKVHVIASPDGSDVTVVDLTRRCRWIWRSRDATFTRNGDKELRPLGRPQVEATGDAIEIAFDLNDGAVRYRWSLGPDHVQINLACDAPDVDSVSLPGPIAAGDGIAQAAVPVYQGLLMRGSSHRWKRRVRHGGHAFFSMAMGVMLSDLGGLLVVHDSPCNWVAHYGQEAHGPSFHFEHQRCPGEGWVDAAVRLYPVDSDVTAACKRYRRRIIEQGRFVGWAEKIDRKPIVADLFGALIAFVGYNRDDTIDYPGSAAKLRAAGFESVFYYPARMCSYSLGFLMGGDDPIWLSDSKIEAMRQVPGAHLSPWGWCFEGLDDGSEAMRSIFRHDASGAMRNWKIDDFQWYKVCTPYQIDHMRKRFATDMAAMDWVHYDVNACRGGEACLAADHAAHHGAPMGSREDTAWIQKLFSPDTVGNRVVSSEGFIDTFASHYDIGSTKCMPLWDGAANCVPVPMTMLVFHDSCIHDWWELHNYNANPGFGLAAVVEEVALIGAGAPRLKAAMDALYGCPPNLFPFGRQYAWRDHVGSESYAFSIGLDDAAVVEAIDCALPIVRLHKRIGRCEMVSWETVSDDLTVQQTVFSDGTRIVANLCDAPREVDGVGKMAGHTWRELT